MKLAFWKRGRSRPRSPAAGRTGGTDPQFESAPFDPNAADPDSDAAEAMRLRVRTRRRLIGALALLLLVVIVVPMLLDPAPRPVPDNIPIDLPSDRTPFAPKLAAPAPEVTAAADGGAAPPAAPGAAADAAVVAGDAGGDTAGAPRDEAAAAKKSPASASKADARHGGGKIFLQAAALASESSAQELVGRLAKSGLNSFVQRTGSGDTVRYRVRLGPYATHDEAEHARARLKSLGVSANIVVA
jgi:DedD protein